MKRSEIRAKQRVVLSSELDATIYEVDSVAFTHVVSLSYYRGEHREHKLRGGMVDISLLQKPSKAQVEHSKSIGVY